MATDAPLPPVEKAPAKPRASSPAPPSLVAVARARIEARAGKEPHWLARLRLLAADRFAEAGIPTVKDEAWKYTNLAALSKPSWRSAPVVDPERVAAAVSALRLPFHGGVHLVFVNGRFAPGLSSHPAAAPAGRVGSLAHAIESSPETVEPWLARLADPAARATTALATAALEDGAFVRLSRETCLPVPIDVLYVSVPAAGSPFLVAPRTLIVAEPESRVTVVERHVSLGEGVYLSTPVTEVSVGRNAVVEHVLWQEEAVGAFHVSSVVVRQEADSRFTGHALTLGAALARNDTEVLLDAEGAEAALSGLYLIFGTRHADHHTRIDHKKPRGISRQIYKGILDGHATGVFDGRIVVHPGAVKTDSKQENHNLLLSDDAVVDAKPQLEIYADDVKCAHGATVGCLDEDEVFYLRSRGIPEGEAKDLLVRAFAREVTDRISIEAVQRRLDAWMTERLPVLGGRTGVE